MDVDIASEDDRVEGRSFSVRSSVPRRIIIIIAFREAIRESALASPSPTSTSSELFDIYDGCLRRIADRFAPEHTACSKVRPLSPWFDADCRAIRRNCRRIERCYRRTKSAQDRDSGSTPEACRLPKEEEQLYWLSRLSNESLTPSNERKSMAKILRRDANPSTPPPSVLTADGFLKFFSKKVESVRSATGGHRPTRDTVRRRHVTFEFSGVYGR